MIDGALTMVLVGTAIQVAPPMRSFVTGLRRRPNARELARALSFMPLPPIDLALEQLIRSVDVALDARA